MLRHTLDFAHIFDIYISIRYGKIQLLPNYKRRKNRLWIEGKNYVVKIYVYNHQSDDMKN